FRSLAEEGKCLLVSSHELEELEKLTSHVVIMARGRIAAADTIARIRQRLADHPVTVRIDLRLDEGQDVRQAAARIIVLPGVSAGGVAEGAPAGIGRLRVRVRAARSFHEAFARLVLEDWLDVAHLGAVDGSAQAVLSYLLGGRR